MGFFTKRRRRSTSSLWQRSLSLEVLEARTVPVVRMATGVDAASIQATVDQFRTDLGTLNTNTAGSFLTGRREINWDGVPDTAASPNTLPADFFNTTSPRGVVFSSPVGGTTFRVSADNNNPTTTPVEFGDLNATYPAAFSVFSAQRLFAPIGSTVTNVDFFVPGTTTPATVSGFGAVFTDVDRTAGTILEFFTPGGTSLGQFAVPTFDDGLSFLGITFDSGERVARVQITTGNAALLAAASPNDVDGAASATDVVAMDDFLYSEPQANPNAVAVDSTTNALVRFNTQAPGTLIGAPTPVVGLTAGENLVGIDFRPATNQLFGLAVTGTAGRLVTINTTTGVLTQVGATFTVSGTDFGFDFNPTNDRIRVVSDTDINLALHPDTGAVTTQTPLNPADPTVVASGYTNSAPGATTTTLLGIDAASDMLVSQNPPGNGTLTNVGSLGVNANGLSAMDIEGGTNTIYAALNIGASSTLFTINRSSGTATPVGVIGAALTVRAMALVPPPVFQINDVTVTEGTGGTVNAVFTVTALGDIPVGQTVSVRVASADGTAVSPDDFAALASTTLTFTTATASQTVTVVVAGDAIDENDETFTLNLSTPVGGNIADNQGVGTITDDDLPPTVSISDVTVTEGNDGSTVNAVFTVTLSGPSGLTVTVPFTTANGTAVAPGDFTSLAGTLTFAPGDTSETITITVNGDNLDESNETFNVNLDAPTNATIGDGQGVGTITDDDATPTLSISSTTVTEGNTGTVNAVFTVTLSAASGQTVTVNFATADGTATAGSDYIAQNGTLTFNAGETTKQISVVVNGDTLDEANEMFNVGLSSPVNATIAPAAQVLNGTIVDDDTAGTVQYSASSFSVAEGAGSSVITVTRTGGTASGVTVQFAATPGSASSADFTTTSGTLTFGAGETSKTFTVAVTNDSAFESGETVNLTLTNATGGATLGTPGTAVLTILNDDGTDDQRWLAQAYRDLLFREIDSVGLQTWGNELEDGATHEEVTLGILGSVEYTHLAINQIYQLYLRRDVDASGLETYTRLLSEGVSPDQVQAYIIGSPEYFEKRAGSTNDGFLTAVYQDVLGRAIEPGGLQSWGQLLSTGTSRTVVAAMILGSTEADAVFVNRLYNQYLDRDADAAGQANWVNILRDTEDRDDDDPPTEANVIAGIIGSVEYNSLAQR